MNIHKTVTYLIDSVGISKAKTAELLEVDSRTVSNILADRDYKAVKIPVYKETMGKGI